jgi:hypothetical protein
MGVRHLKSMLPRHDIQDVYSYFKSSVLTIDAANLLYKCALRECASFVINNYVPALKLFQTQILYMKSKKVQFKMVFDGCVRLEKAPEIERRQNKRLKAETNLKEKRHLISL